MTEPADRAPRFALFETPLGACSIVWAEAGITGLRLPDASPTETRRRTSESFAATEAAPNAAAKQAIRRVVALLEGKPAELNDIELDMTGVPPFHQKVYVLARTIAPGQTLSYGEVAQRLGSPGAARAVGQALGRNPFALIVPCHRVLAASGKLHGFTAHGGLVTKAAILAIERGA